MTRNTSVCLKRRRHATLGRAFACMGVALGLSLAWASDARASTYRVYTSTAATSMTVNANDGACSLAEAVLHVNGQNNNVTYCQDFAPGGDYRIEFLESSGKSFSANHFKINAKLTFTRNVRVLLAGRGASIDSSSNTSAFVVGVKGSASPQPRVFFDRLTLTNTAGSAGGRLIENYGTLGMYGMMITKGDVTQHQNGFGGGIYNAGTIDSAVSVQIISNRAKKGGGLYNDAGTITQLASSSIMKNTATLAGGGIYNAATGPTATGKILVNSLTIEENSARTGGGIFNRGWVELTASYVRKNFTTTTGMSGETCTGVSCDGTGGGVVSVHPRVDNVDLSGVYTRFNLMDGSELSNNTAEKRGGGVSSAGNLELSSSTVSYNSAPDGAAIYVMSPTDGSSEYCNITGMEDYGPSVLNANSATTGYSIVSGSAVNGPYRCSFASSGYAVAFGNSGPKFCKPEVLRVETTCPQ